MSLWPRILARSERHARQFRSAWYRWWFLLTEKPRHRSVELGKQVVFNVPIRGGLGVLRVGDDTTLGFRPALRLGSGEILLRTCVPEAEIAIGQGNRFNNNTSVCAMQRIRIGDDCRIGDYVAIYDADFHELQSATRDRSAGVVKPVIIGNKVWIGSRAMILKGVTVGDEAVIGAMSVVTKAVPAKSIVAGIPAKVVGKIE